MSLNKFMHPRNKYRKPPDFKALAIKYPEFRKYAKQDISGKVSLNFKDLNSLRALTTTLLKEDFDLNVEIPVNRLIPTLPLRLNYLLWIEDILNAIQRKSDIQGIDIGCGASCIYPLLAAKHFHWKMLATETDTESAFTASSNIRKNKLQDMIKLRTVEEGTMLEGVVNHETVYDFCLCNPPFFSSTEELDPQHLARSSNRNPPRNAQSGITKELVIPGGETAFVARIIQDSVKLKELVRVYSVMLGHKASVSKVKQALREAGVTQVITSEFCQGRTTRWGIAWTLDCAIDLAQVNDVGQIQKKKVPFSHTFELDLADTVVRLHQLMNELQIKYSTLKNSDELCAMEISAMNNTWTNLRKKRRQEKFKQKAGNSLDTDSKDCNSEFVNDEKKESERAEINCINRVGGDNSQGEKPGGKSDTDFSHEAASGVDNKSIVDSEEGNDINESKDANKRFIMNDDEDTDQSAPKRPKLENCISDSNCSLNNEPFMNATLVVRKTSQGSLVELCWLRGTGSRDACHQVLQYFKNKIKTN